MVTSSYNSRLSKLFSRRIEYHLSKARKYISQINMIAAIKSYQYANTYYWSLIQIDEEWLTETNFNINKYNLIHSDAKNYFLTKYKGDKDDNYSFNSSSNIPSIQKSTSSESKSSIKSKDNQAGYSHFLQY